jgi:hypothetical protein
VTAIAERAENRPRLISIIIYKSVCDCMILWRGERLMTSEYDST